MQMRKKIIRSTRQKLMFSILCMAVASSSGLTAQDVSPYLKYDGDFLGNDHHMLAESSDGRLVFTVDPSVLVRMANSKVGGISLSGLAEVDIPYTKSTHDYNMPPALEDRGLDLRIPFMRCNKITATLGHAPGGHQMREEGIDMMHDLSSRWDIPEEDMMIELEVKPGSEIGRLIKYSMDKGYGFRYWQIVNEPFNFGGYTPDTYVAQFEEVCHYLKDDYSDALLGVCIKIKASDYNAQWRGYILDQLKGKYDFIIPNAYNPGKDTWPETYEDRVLANNWGMVNLCKQVKAMADDFNPDQEIYLRDAEWGVNSGKNRDTNPFNGAYPSAMHRLVRIMHYAQGEYMKSASAWTLFAYQDERIGFGMIPKQSPEKSTLTYWMFYYFNRFCGTRIPKFTGSCPYYTGFYDGNEDLFGQTRMNSLSGPATPVLITLNEEQSMLLIILVNGLRDTEVPCQFEVENAIIHSHSVVMLRHDNPYAEALLANEAKLINPSVEIQQAGDHYTLTVPGHSAIFMELDIEITN